MKNFKNLFPVDFAKNRTPKYLGELFGILSKKSKDNQPRVSSKKNQVSETELVKKYSKINLNTNNPFEKGKEIVNDLFEGIPNWRSSNQNLNIGSPVNIVASAVNSLSLDLNIISVNKGLAGKTLIAERAVCNILGGLISKKGIKGLFTYGGSGTNLYGMKVGLQKALPESNRKRVKKNVKVLVTEDSHFAQVYSADWLGIGSDNVLKIKANKDRTSSLKHTEEILRSLFEKKVRVGVIILNGGTSYAHTVDDLKKFVSLRNRLAIEYKLDYVPHIHVDAVIGWMWLFFKDYDFVKNPLKIKKDALERIKRQYKRISQIRYVDSWGADFHKGIGGCPVVSSIFMFNNKDDLKLISKKDNLTKGMHHGLHQISERFNEESPVNYTLENSRSSASSLSALASLHTLGKNGFRTFLSKLVENVSHFHSLLEGREDIEVIEPYKYGFVIMLRLYPPRYVNKKMKAKELSDKKIAKEINDYNREFFKWDSKIRISKNNSPEYSYSTRFYELPCKEGMHTLKIYPVSPYVNEKDTKNLIRTIIFQKDIFDRQNSL